MPLEERAEEDPVEEHEQDAGDEENEKAFALGETVHGFPKMRNWACSLGSRTGGADSMRWLGN